MAEVIRLVVGPTLTNTYLVKSGNDIIVIDPAFEAQKLIKAIEKLAGKVRYILNTHGHIDHISANQAIEKEFGGEILIHKADASLLSNPEENLSLFFSEPVKNSSPTRLLAEGDLITVEGLSLKVLSTPGHTEGSCCFLSDRFVFTGDTLFYDSIGRTDLPGGSEKKIFASLKKLLKILNDEQTIYPGHGEFGLFRLIKRVNPFLQFDED